MAAKLTGWKIDIFSTEGEGLAEADGVGNVAISDEVSDVKADDGETKADTLENEEGTTTKKDGHDPLEDDDTPTKGRDLAAPDRAEDNVTNTPEEFETLVSEAETEDDDEAKAAAK